MKWKKLEHKIKQNISEHKSSVDVRDIWANIDSKVSDLNKKRRKRRYFFWFWTSTSTILLLGLGAYWWFQMGNDAHKLTNHQQDIINKKNQGSKSKEQHTLKLSDVENVKKQDKNTLFDSGESKYQDNKNTQVKNDNMPNITKNQDNLSTDNNFSNNLADSSGINANISNSKTQNSLSITGINNDSLDKDSISRTSVGDSLRLVGVRQNPATKDNVNNISQTSVGDSLRLSQHKPFNKQNYPNDSTAVVKNTVGDSLRLVGVRQNPATKDNVDNISQTSVEDSLRLSQHKPFNKQNYPNDSTVVVKNTVGDSLRLVGVRQNLAIKDNVNNISQTFVGDSLRLSQHKPFNKQNYPNDSTVVVKNKAMIYEPYLSSDKLLKIKPILPAKDTISFDNVELPKSKKRPQSSAFYILAYGGISQIYKTLETEQNTIPINREDTEVPLEAIQVGLKALFEHHSGFELGIGFQRTTLNERFNYQDTLTSTSLVEGVEFLRVKLDRDIQELSGTISSTTTTTINKIIYNQYQFYDIPLSLAYHKRIKSWKVGLRVGLIANLQLKTKGQILDATGNVSNIEENQEQFFKNRLSLGYSFSLPISKYLFKNFSLHIVPTFDMYPSITQDFYTDNQKYNLLGLRFGLMYRIK